jgi:antirestriction protein ArdC
MQQNQRSGTFGKVYQDINNKVMAELAKGNIFWRRPWNPHGWYPMNFTSNKRYRGWNFFYLQYAISEHQFPTPWFVTFKQAQALGGSVKKGSKGFPIVKWIEPDKPQPEAANPGVDEQEHKRRLFPVNYVVFNVDQTEGLNIPQAPPVPTSFDKIAGCEVLLDSMHDLPKIVMSDDCAAYNWRVDRVHMPKPEQFPIREEYYSTLFHELIHATGHPKRLNRPGIVESDGFGGPKYTREELVAEFGAAYLCGITRIAPKTLTNSVAYIESWLKGIKDDPTILLKATSNAQAAIDYLLPEIPENTFGPVPTEALPADDPSSGF